MAEEKLNQWSEAYHGNYQWFTENQIDISSIDKKDGSGRTALYSASKKGHLNVVMHLVLKGADINLKGAKGSTPLHSAAFCGHGTIVQFLVGYGCDRNIKNQYGLTAADEAKDDKIKKMILYPERGSTERFKIRKRNCPAFLSDSMSLIGPNALNAFGFDFSKRDSREKLIKEMTGDYKSYALQLKAIIGRNIISWHKKIVYLYTLESPLYKQMNADLAAVNKLSKHKIYANALSDALDFLRWSEGLEWKKHCYRSVHLNKDQIKSFETAVNGKGEFDAVASLPAFSSCTKLKQIALGWGGNAIMIINPPGGNCKLRGCYCGSGAVDISSISPFHEEEVLLSWSTQLQILNVKKVSHYYGTNVEYEINVHLSSVGA
eukprot:229947_1